MTPGLKSAFLPFFLLLFALPQSRSAPDAPCVPDEPGDKAAPNETYRTFKWGKGDPPIEMIRADEGFCFLSGVGGSFAGGGERVRVCIRDGWWYLEGTCMLRSLWAEAMSVRHEHGRERGACGERKRRRSRRQSWRIPRGAGTLGP